MNVPSDVGVPDVDAFDVSALAAEASLAKPKKMFKLLRRMFRLKRAKDSSLKRKIFVSETFAWIRTLDFHFSRTRSPTMKPLSFYFGIVLKTRR